MEKIKIPVELKQAICNNELIVFVGAGLSYDFYNINGQQLEGWSNLVKHILLHLQSKDYDVAYLLPILKKQEPIKVLDLIASDSTIPKKEISDYLKDFLDLEDAKNDYSLHQLLYELSPKIITTNYDTAFENSTSLLRKNRAYKGKNYELTTHKDANASLLYKLHGCFEDIDSMVLFPKDYKNLYKNKNRDAEHSLLVLRNIIMNKSILFIGTRMGDFQINNIFKEVKKLQGDYNQKHFIITKTHLDSALDFLTPLKIKYHSETKGIIKDLIKIKKESSNNDTEELLKLKEDLQKANKKIKELEAQVNPTKDELLEREALKYFSKGVNFSISNKHKKAIKKYKTAAELKPKFHEAYNNWGIALANLAKTKTDEQKEELYNLAFEKYNKAIEIKPDFHEAYNNWGTDLANLAETKTDEQKEKLYNLAFGKYNKAIEIKPDKHEAYNNWGIGLANLAKTKNDEQREELFNLAFKKYKKAIDIKSDFYEAYCNWGNNLANLAKTKTDEQKEKLYNLAFKKYEKAVDIKPDEHDAYYNWGNNLANLAKTKTDEQKEVLFNLAFEKYEKAIDIKPDFYEAYYNWGNNLANLAKTKTDEQKEVLFNLAFEKYEKAIDIKPDFYEAYCNWGSNLANLAKTKTNEQKEELFNLAFKKYKKAVEIKPDKHEAYYNWGTDLANLAKTKTDEQKEEIHILAFEKLKKGIEHGGRHYNLACLYALTKNKDKTIQHLRESLNRKEKTIQHILENSDFRTYLEDKEFKAIIEKYNN